MGGLSRCGTIRVQVHGPEKLPKCFGKAPFREGFGKNREEFGEILGRIATPRKSRRTVENTAADAEFSTAQYGRRAVSYKWLCRAKIHESPG